MCNLFSRIYCLVYRPDFSEFCPCTILIRKCNIYVLFCLSFLLHLISYFVIPDSLYSTKNYYYCYYYYCASHKIWCTHGVVDYPLVKREREREEWRSPAVSRRVIPNCRRRTIKITCLYVVGRKSKIPANDMPHGVKSPSVLDIHNDENLNLSNGRWIYDRINV